MTPQQQFADAIGAAGLTVPDVIEADGSLHRFASNGNPRDDAGYYALHLDGGIPAGHFGCWRSGVKQTWHAKIDRKLSTVEVDALAQRHQEAERQREADEVQRHAEARQRATERWNNATPADPAHPYLLRKAVKPHGIRQEGDALLVPMRAGGKLHSLQTIAPDGAKRFMKDGRVSGCYFSIGKPNGVLCIVEGFATGASVHQATGHAVAVAFNAGNLEPAARTLREKLPEVRIIVCADDDYRSEGNPGISNATKAASAIDGLLAIPDFGDERPDGVSDFNDLMQHRGAEVVQRAIANASAPHAPEHQSSAPDAPGGEWAEPQPLPDGLLPVASFDMALLPATLRPWIADIAERVQCAPDFVAVAAMTALGAVLGRKIAIRPQAHTDWTEVANQWTLIVGRPGVLKSPAIEQALAPLRRLEARANEEYGEAVREHQVTKLTQELRARASKSNAEKALKKDRNADLRQFVTADDAIEPPFCRRYRTNDSTAASLGELHRQNPNGLLVHRDELVSLLRELEREENAGARGFYLTGWNGDSPYTIDRIGRGFNLHIPAVCLSLLGSTQPGRIASYVRAAMHGGETDDGLIQRFGMLVWPDIGGEWRNVDRWPDTEAKRAAFDVFERLASLDATAVGAQQDVHDGQLDGAPYLRMSDEARELFLEWRTTWESRLRGSEFAPALESHFSKYRKLVPSLALLLHLTAGDDGPGSAAAMLQALAWADYLETHAMRTYASGVAAEVTAAKAIIARIRKGDLAHEFSSRDAWRPGWAGLADPPGVAAALELLVDFDWLDRVRVKTGGREATRYILNPRALR